MAVDADDAPDIVLVFGDGAVADLPAPAIVWLPDARTRPPADLRPGDRVIAPAPGVAGAWRTMPLPVADELFASASERPGTGRALWLGPDCERRRSYLELFEHSVEFVDSPASATVAVNLHDGGEPAFEPRVARALAAGLALVSEPLEPSFGLEPGLDYIEARDMTDVFVAVENAATAPEAYATVARRGRWKAEWFRSSRVVERLMCDLRIEAGALTSPLAGHP
jgi:hypothetical protein